MRVFKVGNSYRQSFQGGERNVLLWLVLGTLDASEALLVALPRAVADYGSPDPTKVRSAVALALSEFKAKTGRDVRLAAVEDVPNDSAYYETYSGHAMAIAQAIADGFLADAAPQFLRCRWKRSHPDEPISLYSELDTDRREARRVKVFRDGTCGWADGSHEVGGTRLGEAPVSPIQQIAGHLEFSPAIITREEVEEIWAKRRERPRSPPFKVICVDNHTFLFVSKEAMLAFNERMERGEGLRGDRCHDLTIGKVYEVTETDRGMYRIIDDSGEDYLYGVSRFRRI